VVEHLHPGDEKNYLCKFQQLTLKKTLTTVENQSYTSIEINSMKPKAEEPNLVAEKEVKKNENLKDMKAHQRLVTLLADNLLIAASDFFK